MWRQTFFSLLIILKLGSPNEEYHPETPTRQNEVFLIANNLWNLLPEDDVMATSFNCLKWRLDKFIERSISGYYSRWYVQLLVSTTLWPWKPADGRKQQQGRDIAFMLGLSASQRHLVSNIRKEGAGLVGPFSLIQQGSPSSLMHATVTEMLFISPGC